MRKIVLVLGLLILLTGCNNLKKTNKVYLDDNFYGKNSFIEVSSSEIENLKDSTYVLFTYNNYCTMPISCEGIFKSFMEKYNIAFYAIPYSDFKETYIHDTVSFAPSVIIVKNGKIVDYLNADKDEDYDAYQDLNKFTDWIDNYIYISK